MVELSSLPAFGIPPLDQLLGAAKPGGSVLLAADPGVEGAPFLYQALQTHLDAGRPVRYVVTDVAPSSVIDGLARFGLALDDDQEIEFVDAFSARMGLASEAAHQVADPTDPDQLVSVLEKACAGDESNTVLVLSGLSTFLDAAEGADLGALAPRLRDIFHQHGLTIGHFIQWPYGDGAQPLLEVFDAQVDLHTVEGRLVTSQFFEVSRTPWAEVQGHAPRMYKVVRPGGVNVYIPKIVVTGPYNAGKSSFIHTVSDDAVSVDRLGTTVAMDHGHATLNGISLDLFGTPGQARFDPILRTIARHALGVVLVVDATKPDSFGRAREMLDQTWRLGLPAVVLANKQDLPNALDPNEVAHMLNLPEEIAVAGCIGRDRDSARGALAELVEAVLRSGVAMQTFGGDARLGADDDQEEVTTG